MRLRQPSSARWQQVPDGMRDLLPEDTERWAVVQAGFREVTRRWGYREVVTPTLEYLETVQRGAGPGVQDRLFKLVDRGGEILALRPEMTVPIARLAVSRLLAGQPLDLRLSYVAPVFRGQDAGRGRLREFTQAGVELLGGAGPDADAEVIALAVEALRQTGIERPTLHLGHLGFLTDALGYLGEDGQEELRDRLYRKEFAGIEQGFTAPSLARFLQVLPSLHGPDALPRAAPCARSELGLAALEHLASVLDRLADYGVADYVAVDMRIVRDFSYYTGVVFEAYASGSGYPILGGGRYDTLLARFGTDCPATGFAIGVERVLSAIPRSAPRPIDAVIGAAAGSRAQAIRLARALRDQGKSVVAYGEGTHHELVTQAAKISALQAMWVEEHTVRVVDLARGQERTLGHRDLIVEARRAPIVSWTH